MCILTRLLVISLSLLVAVTRSVEAIRIMTFCLLKQWMMLKNVASKC